MGSGELARWLRLRKLCVPVVSCCSEYSLARPEPQHFSKSCVAVVFFFFKFLTLVSNNNNKKSDAPFHRNIGNSILLAKVSFLTI